MLFVIYVVIGVVIVIINATVGARITMSMGRHHLDTTVVVTVITFDSDAARADAKTQAIFSCIRWYGQ